MQTLYKRDTKGKIRAWKMEIEAGRYRTIAGIYKGTLVTSAWTQAESKNVGRSNETSPDQQAVLEVDAAYTKKLEKAYTRNLDEIDEQTFRSPMLAKKYEDVKFTFPVFSQPKLDGIRCITNARGMWTRTGKPILGALHIFEALAPLFKGFPNTEFDGELYNHELHDDFNAIVSMVRRAKQTPEQQETSRRMVQYHVYDLVSAASEPFCDRILEAYSLLPRHLDPVIQLVQTHRAPDQSMLDKLYEEYMEDKYEGQMIRANEPYEFKRSKTLLKRKEFQDAEFEIKGIEPGVGNWAGRARKIICWLGDGRDFKADFCGTMAEAKNVLDRADEFIGKETTVTFFNYTPAGKPRFGKAKALHLEARI